jgi:hypothetical protein
MNKRQRALLIESISIIIITIVAVIAMINLKDYVNRSEAMRAIAQLGEKVLKYRETNGSLPPQSYVEQIKEGLEGHVRLGKLQYRARWIDLGAHPDEILAYTEKKYRSSFLDDGYVILRLDGRVQWMRKEEFEKLLAQQQTSVEKQMIQN